MAGNSKNKTTKNGKLNASRNMSRYKTNPIYRNPVVRPRINFSFDGQILNGTGFSAPMVTLANIASAVYYVNCSNNISVFPTANKYIQSVALDYNTITKVYNEYKYHTLQCHWLPFVSPGVTDGGSQVYVAYVDNAEEIAALDIATAANTFNTSKAARNMKFFNAWERFTYNVPLSSRRKMFDTNLNDVIIADTVDRGIQGAVVVGSASGPTPVSLGQWRFTYTLELRTLNNQLTT
jgi:hypothetical protein